MSNYEPCECCGVPVTLEAVDPNDAYPGNAPWIWREQWREIGALTLGAAWHSAARCRAARVSADR